MLSSNQLIYFCLLLCGVFLIYCNQESSTISQRTTFVNLQDSVQYMGMNTCRSCHNDVYESFIETGMGRSFDHASREKSDAVFDEHALVYDPHKNFYYQPFFKDSILFIKEFRLEKGDTTFQRIEKIDYIVGSGQHTNSHIIDFNGYIYQAPITYYTQDGKWDMAPGFKEGTLDRFDRFLTSECLTCHNHYPTQIEGSINKYVKMPTGIECERCHGPGEIHVKEKLAGELIDTSKYIDYSIVNPAHLERDLQLDICQRCHLQGVAILEDGKSFYDFKPGMKLSDVFNVFLPRYSNSHDKFIMASQADRLKKSPCFLQSQEMTCLTCHHPHHSVKTKSNDDYNNACKNCHTPNTSLCAVAEPIRLAENNNCVKCHMPPSGSIDIPHVNITDHYISKSTAKRKEISTKEKNEIAQFLGLEILTKDKADDIEIAKGYIALFDKYVDRQSILDSAKYYLDRSYLPLDEKRDELVHYYFAKEEYQEIISLMATIKPNNVSNGWTAYRTGEAFYKNGEFLKALSFYEKAVSFYPYNLDFQEKKGSTELTLGQLKKAKSTLDFVISENPKRKKALCNIGFVEANFGNFTKADQYYDKALALDPDYEQALINKAALLLVYKRGAEAALLAKRVLKINSKNEQALQILERIRQ